MPSILNSLKMISDPTRLRILLLLGDESLSVAELQQILGMGQSRISTQLSQLKKEGLVADQRSGKNNIYSAQVPPALKKIIREAGSELPNAPKINHPSGTSSGNEKTKSEPILTNSPENLAANTSPAGPGKGLPKQCSKSSTTIPSPILERAKALFPS
jgi:ArsR family transcriptional regulator